MNRLRHTFDKAEPRFEDLAISEPRQNVLWEPVIVSKRMMDREIQRLASIDRPANGRRESLIIHPKAAAGAPGLAPGIQVKLSVLKPGEETTRFRHNAAEVCFCIQGGGEAVIGAKTVRFDRYDVWTNPSYATHHYRNDREDLQVRLTYSNAPLLQFMQVHICEEEPDEAAAVDVREDIADPAGQSPYGVLPLGTDGAKLMPYERLINPPPVRSPALIWPWAGVKEELDKLIALGDRYVGRRLYLLYNEMTGRTNGTTPNFFATMTIRPPGVVDRPHRHVSAAINYYFHGTGRSTVASNTYEWGPGDLMLSAPGWAVHNHASYDDHVYELTVQDQPLNIAMQSLLWQEDLRRPPALLGAQPGFVTNRSAIGA